MDFMKKLNPFKRHRQVQQQGVLPHPQQLQQLQISDSKRKAADKELQNLNQKIEKILANLDENEADADFSREEECVVCLSAKATMKTYPCGHCVVCRLCFVKTIQSAVTDRRLPLKCVVCRTKILKLKQQRPRPSSNSRSRAPSTTATSTSSTAAHPRGGQQSVPRSGTSATPCRRPSALANAGSLLLLKPTATKLMQPLLIYPAQRSGDPKLRVPGIGWSSPSGGADGRTVDLGPTANTSLRLRAKNGGSGAGGSATMVVSAVGGGSGHGGSAA